MLFAKNTSDVTYTSADINCKIDKTFDAESYIVVCGKILLAEGTNPREQFRITLVDEGGEDHILTIIMFNGTATSDLALVDRDSDGKTDDVNVNMYHLFTDGKYWVLQFKIADIFENAGLTTNIVKATQIQYAFLQNCVASSDNEGKALFRMFFISEKKITVNSKPLNGTSVQLDSDTIDINCEIEKIVDVQIPFRWQPEAEKAYDDKNQIIDYDFEFLLPDDTALSFSDVKLNFTVPSGEIQSLWINGQDYLSNVENKDPGTEITLLSSISAGTQYIVNCKVKYSEEEYYELAQQIKLAWWSPRSWIDKLLAVLLAIVNFFGGIGATYIKRLRAKVRTP